VALWKGKILAATDNNRLYVLDPVTFKPEKQYSAGYPVRRAFQKTTDDRMFFIQSGVLSEIDPATFKPVNFASPLAGISGGGAIADGRIYFIAEHRLVHSCAIPEQK
jgi:outer membrane protein assembly factor BamB